MDAVNAQEFFVALMETGKVEDLTPCGLGARVIKRCAIPNLGSLENRHGGRYSR